MNWKISSLTKSCDAIRLLTRIQTKYPSAIIAGGYIRDLYHGVPYTDCDIFLWNPDSGSNGEWSGPVPDVNDPDYIKQLVGFHSRHEFDDEELVWAHDPEDGNDYTLTDQVRAVWNVSLGEDDYQLVFVNERPTYHVGHFFDIGLCKAWCDGKKVHFMEEFMTDSTNKTITICDATLSKKHFNYILKMHLPRIKRKYPGYKVVVSETNLPYVDTYNKKYL